MRNPYCYWPITQQDRGSLSSIYMIKLTSARPLECVHYMVILDYIIKKYSQLMTVVIEHK